MVVMTSVKKTRVPGKPEAERTMQQNRGTLVDTYVAALQHDLVELPSETITVGVV